MKRVIKWFLICGIIVAFISITAVLFYEPSEPPSTIYDKVFVQWTEPIRLESRDIDEVQQEIISYVMKWEKQGGLIRETVGFDRAGTYYLTFLYELNDVEGMAGRLSVVCGLRDNEWYINSANCDYNEIYQMHGDKDIEDKDLEKKVQVVKDFLINVNDLKSHEVKNCILDMSNGDTYFSIECRFSETDPYKRMDYYGMLKRDDENEWNIEITRKELWEADEEDK